VVEIGSSSLFADVDLESSRNLKIAARGVVTRCVQGLGTGGFVEGLGTANPTWSPLLHM